MLKQSVFVLAIAACGGGAKSSGNAMTPEKPLPSSECAMMASHVADVVMTFKEPPPTTKDVVANVVTKRCEADAWSADAKKCLSVMANEDDAKKCITTTLTDDQHKKVMDDMDARMGHHKHHDDADINAEEGMPAPASAPPPRSKAPAAPAKGPTKPTSGADPCEGGE